MQDYFISLVLFYILFVDLLNRLRVLTKLFFILLVHIIEIAYPF